MAFLSTRALLVLGVSMVVALHCAAAVSHTVGGAPGWTLPSSNTLYTSWVGNNTFEIGDSLVFNFTTNAHNVLLVTQANYQNCSTSGPLETYNTGPATVQLHDLGPHYYICGIAGHCSAGQKVVITVSAASASPPIPTTTLTLISTTTPTPSSPPPISARTLTAPPSPPSTSASTLTVLPSPSPTSTSPLTVLPSPSPTSTSPLTVLPSPSPPPISTRTVLPSPSPSPISTRTLTPSPSPPPISSTTLTPSPSPPPISSTTLTPSPSPPAAVTSYPVGGRTGWIVPSGNLLLYDNWAANITFQLGNSLVFNFTTNVHNVLEVTQANYNSCTATGPLKNYTIGPATVNLTEPGAHYYICGVAGHCSAGQKLKITVSGEFLSPNHQKKWMPSIEAAVGVASGVFVISFIIFIYIRINRKKRDLQEEEDIRGYMDPLDSRHPSVENFLHAGIPTRYSYRQIKRYSNNFATKLGQGGFGTVFKGELPYGCMVAIKILDKSKHSRIQFMNEVATIGRIHHLHLVRLLGYCLEGSKRALVYEYMVNGSLEKYIHGDDQNALNWKQLHFIAMGTARGLAYLHDDCRNKILHCDIKPHNVLLDANFSPKVADFGLAKLTDREESHVSLTGARGTPGYVAPEVWSRSNGPVTDRSDVYSYGMLVMEMVGGRKNFDMKASRSSKFYYPEWAFKQVEMGEFRKLREENIIDAEDETIAKKLSMLGLWCIQYSPSQRPCMSRVIQMLEGTVDIAMPPQPFPVNTSIETEASTESSSLH